MKTVALEDLKNIRFTISDISTLYMRSGWTRLDSPCRRMNGFLLIDKGECTYYWDDKEAVLSHGSMIYLPHGSRHVVKTESFKYYRINFEIYDADDGENIIFTKQPWVITNDAPSEMFEHSRNLTQNTLSDSNIFSSTADLCNIFSSIQDITKPKQESRISAAVDHINLHYIENFSVEQLADMCYMSQSHLHRLFKQELNESPIEYRNRLRVKKACALLGDRECSINEIASMLGFESIYYFSRAFKNYMGVSPTEYRKTVVR